ncbi:hypothetical protein J3R83DRAFT_13519, partial [Lanmaoa asiatica]
VCLSSPTGKGRRRLAIPDSCYHQRARSPICSLCKETCKLPTQCSAYAASFNLYSAEGKVIPAYGKALFNMAISVALLCGTYGRIAPHSGLAAKNMLNVGAKVIDTDYRGPLGVL